MKLTTTIDVALRVSARLEDDGSSSVTVFATAPYAKGRTTTITVTTDELPEQVVADLAEALRAAQEAAAPLLGTRIQRAVHKTTEVAAAHAEI